MGESVAERVRAIVASQGMLEAAEVTDEASIESLGLDSLALVEVIFAIEEEFDISVPFNANDPGESEFDVSTVGSIVSAVENLVREQTGS